MARRAARMAATSATAEATCQSDLRLPRSPLPTAFYTYWRGVLLPPGHARAPLPPLHRRVRRFRRSCLWRSTGSTLPARCFPAATAQASLSSFSLFFCPAANRCPPAPPTRLYPRCASGGRRHQGLARAGALAPLAVGWGRAPAQPAGPRLRATQSTPPTAGDARRGRLVPMSHWCHCVIPHNVARVQTTIDQRDRPMLLGGGWDDAWRR